MRVLVTGGFGFIGSHLVEALVARGHNVCILDIKTDCYYPDQAFKAFLDDHSVEVIQGNICDLDSCIEASRGVDVILHTAAMALIRKSYENPKATYDINVQGTENILKASVINKIKKIIYSQGIKDLLQQHQKYT